jgi:hypothetical protein
MFGLSASESRQELNVFVSPDANLTAVVLNTPNNESRLEVRQAGGALVSVHDFSSSDGEHGYKANKAQWTANSKFFVVSLSSSGGHSPIYEPLVCWSRRDNLFYQLRDYTALGGFEIIAPDALSLKTWPGLRKVTVNLYEVTVNSGDELC